MDSPKKLPKLEIPLLYYLCLPKELVESESLLMGVNKSRVIRVYPCILRLEVVLQQNESKWSNMSGSVYVYTPVLYAQRYNIFYLHSSPARAFALCMGRVIKYC